MLSLILLLVLMVVGEGQGYAMYPPVLDHPEICETMYPSGHNVSVSTDECPYRLVVNTANCYSSSNQTIYVTVHHIREEGFYEGLFVQARPVGGDTTSVGVFGDNGDVMLAPLSCGAGINNTIGHYGHDHFLQQVFTWTPPDGFQQDFQFVATMVRRITIFWLDVRSPVLHYSPTCSHSDVTKPSLLPPTAAPSIGGAAARSSSFLLYGIITSFTASLYMLLLKLNY